MGNTELSADPAVLNGVKPANQARSVDLQLRFARAGREMLVNQRLADIRIPALSKRAGSSIGGFYSRFENREVFFRFLQVSMLEENRALVDRALAPEHLHEMSEVEVIENVVATMIKVFSSPWRGVMRESYASIAEGRDIWAPMRERGREIADAVAAHFKERYAGRADGPDTGDILFAMQMLFSALNNDLMNPKLRYSIGERAFEQKLAEMLFRFLNLKTDKRRGRRK